MAESPSDNTRRLEIRKYPNRRYYDTTRSRHVTLEEIYQGIREGYEVQITDSKSNEDITAKVLAQIIIELDPPKLGVFPVPLLHRLLRSNEQLVTDFITKYFNQPLMAFLDSQRNFEQSLRQVLGLHSPVPTVADWTKMMFGSFSPVMWTGGPAGAPRGAAPAPQPAPPQEQSAEAGADSPQATPADLRRMMDELQQQLNSLQSQLETTNNNHSRKKAAKK